MLLALRQRRTRLRRFRFPFVSRRGERYVLIRESDTLSCHFAQKARKARLVTTQRLELKTLRILRSAILTDLSK
jgi:hypothetical protein